MPAWQWMSRCVSGRGSAKVPAECQDVFDVLGLRRRSAERLFDDIVEAQF
jgi:hypothetical protein